MFAEMTSVCVTGGRKGNGPRFALSRRRLPNVPLEELFLLTRLLIVVSTILEEAAIAADSDRREEASFGLPTTEITWWGLITIAALFSLPFLEHPVKQPEGQEEKKQRCVREPFRQTHD